MPPGSTAKPPPPAAETVANHGAESSSREYAQPAAGWCRSGSQNPARSSRCDRLAVGEMKESFWGDLYGQTKLAWQRFFELQSERQRDRYSGWGRYERRRDPPENVGNAH